MTTSGVQPGSRPRTPDTGGIGISPRTDAPAGDRQPAREHVEPTGTEPGKLRAGEAHFRAPLLDRLRAIEGFDVDLALRYTGGQASVLERVLRRFVATYRQGLPTLLNVGLDEHEAILRWRAACHSARGALGLIGATRLIESVTGFERALNELAPLATLSVTGRQVHDHLVAFVGRIAVELETRAAGKD